MGAGVLLLLLTLLTTATLAAADSPPPTVVAQFDSVSTNPTLGLNNFTLNVTIIASPDDPNRDGALTSGQYYLGYNDTTGWTQLLPFAEKHVPNRAQWYYFTQNFSTSRTSPTYQFNVSFANVTTFVVSPWSCTVSLLVTDPHAHDQCGNITIQPPAELTGYVNGTQHAGVIDTRWPTSADDPRIGGVYGDYSYYVNITAIFLGGKNPIFIQNTTANFANSNLPFISATQMNEYPGHGGSLFTTFIVAVDTSGTHQWSAPSCAITLKGSDLNATATCGNSTLLSGFTWPADLPTFGDGSPQFPGVDIATTSTAMGITGSALGIILGSILILAGAIGGYLIAKNAGTATGATLSLALAGLSNLYPMWLIVTIFLTIIALITFLLTKEN